MRRPGETFDARYEAELVLIEFFALLVLLFLLSSGPAPNPVSHTGAPPVAVQPAPAPAKAVERPAAAPAKPQARSASAPGRRAAAREIAATAGEQL